MEQFHGTTIISVRDTNSVALGGDGQVSLGDTVMKGNAVKVRKLYQDKVLAGFAGSTADAFTLFEKFEAALEKYQGQLTRAAVELAKEWRSDRALRKLVIEPEHGVLAIGSGGHYAHAAATALVENTELGAPEVVDKALMIAASICVYTNSSLTIETLDLADMPA